MFILSLSFKENCLLLPFVLCCMNLPRKETELIVWPQVTNSCSLPKGRISRLRTNVFEFPFLLDPYPVATQSAGISGKHFP